MRLYQASLFLHILKRYWEIFHEPLNVLLSFAIMGGETEGFLVDNRHMVGGIVADSGAWTAAQGNANISIKKLISYLLLWGDMFDLYFNLDSDFRSNGFGNNIDHQIQMEKSGLKPVPVIHNFFDDEIEYYVKSGKYDWLALGSSQSTNFDDIRYAVDRIRTWGNPNIKIHWFGGSKYEWLCRLPISACDTTSWAATGTYGYVNYWNPHEEGFNKAHRIYISGRIKPMEEGEYDFVTYKWKREVEEYIYNTFGYTYQDLCGYGDKDYMQVINARFYAELERRINEERVKRGIPLE